MFSLTAIILASRSSIWNWPLGLIGQVFLFFLFFKNQLYGNMILQAYFTTTSLYGWSRWSKKEGKMIRNLSLSNSIILSIIIVSLIATFGSILTMFQPKYPYLDASVTILSMVAVLLMTHKVLESWYIWILINVMCIVLYYLKGFYFLSIEYIFVLCIAVYGLTHWNRIYKAQ